MNIKGKEKIIRRNKRVSFGRIWIEIALPVVFLAVIALAVMSHLLLTGLFMQEELRASEVSYEITLRLKEKDLPSQREYADILNLERSQMVAVLYDGEGNLLCESNVDEYDDWRHIFSKENYHILLERLKEIPMNSQRERAGIENVDLYGVSYLYGRKYFTVDEDVYQLRYGALISPWNRHSRMMAVTGLLVIFNMFLLTYLIARHYYRIYRERILAEEYYRNTSNALAHDLKTPLMAISGYAEILQENVHVEKRNYYAEGILKNVSIMNSLIENVLELARLENPRMLPQKEDINLLKLTDEVLKQFQFEIKSKELKVSVEGEVSEAALRADRTLMKRALENLISNAVKYTPEGNEITIAADKSCFTIKNTGVMIPEDKLAHVWEPFVKGENARSGVSGTGIGLTIVKEIMDMHGFGYKIGNEENSVNVALSFR